MSDELLLWGSIGLLPEEIACSSSGQSDLGIMCFAIAANAVRFILLFVLRHHL